MSRHLAAGFHTSSPSTVRLVLKTAQHAGKRIEGESNSSAFGRGMFDDSRPLRGGNFVPERAAGLTEPLQIAQAAWGIDGADFGTDGVTNERLRQFLIGRAAVVSGAVTFGSLDTGVAAAASASLQLLVEELDQRALHPVRARAERAREQRQSGSYEASAFRAELASLHCPWDRERFALQFFGIDRPAVLAVAGERGDRRYAASPLDGVLGFLDALPHGCTLIDHGCGPGLVVLLHAFLNGGRAVGIDMQPGAIALGEAAARATALPNATFIAARCTPAAIPALPPNEPVAHYFFYPFEHSVAAPIVEHIGRTATARTAPTFFGGLAPPKPPLGFIAADVRSAGFTAIKTELYVHAGAEALPAASRELRQPHR